MKSTRKRRALWRTWLSSVLLSGALASAVTAAPLLDKATIIRLYENMLVEDGNPPPDLSDADVVWKEGSLTSPGATEAIASVTSVAAFAHVQGFAHVLFLRYSGGWLIDRELTVGDTASISLMDIEGDGQKEVWIETAGGNMGEMHTSGTLVSLSTMSARALFSFEGENTRATAMDRTQMDEHSAQFTDLDNDRVPEIVDTEEIGTYANRGDTEVELSHKTVKTYWKYRNGVYVKYEPAVAAPAPKPSPGGDDPVAFAIDQMKKTDVVWTPVFYASTWGVYKIGGRIAMAGGAYILLESPKLAVDMVLGGLYKPVATMGKDLALTLIESAVKTPRKVCLGICKNVIDGGWEEYKVAYEIARNYQKSKTLSRPDALKFLRYRFGPNRMAAARVLYEQIGIRDYKPPDQQVAEKTTKTLIARYEKAYRGGQGPPMADLAFFMRDMIGILEDSKLGMMDYPPYVDFMGKMESINRSLIDEARRFGNAPASAVISPPAPAEPPAPPPGLPAREDAFLGLESDTIGLWHFNEGQGDIAYDESPGRMNIRLQGVMWENGRFGKCIRIHGQGANATAMNQSVMDRLSTFTIEFWLKGWRGGNLVINKDIVGTYSTDWLLSGYSANRLYFGFNGNEGECSNAAIDPEKWTYVVVVRDMQRDFAGIYLNGRLDMHSSKPLTRISVPDPLTLGQWSSKHDAFADMEVDELRISTTAKSDSELLATWEASTRR